MRYEIDETNAIRVYNDGETVPFCFQPDWPDTTPWADRAEAENWAQLLIESMQNPDAEFIPGVSPDKHPTPKPQPQADTEA